MQRILILGRGASGKSALANRLSALTGIELIELDKVFWQAGLTPLSRTRWIEIQQRLAASKRWIMDGDLGPYDAVEVRLRAADTIVLLDFALPRCVWRAARRSRERLDFWRCVFTYRSRYRPLLLQAIAKHAPAVPLHILRNPAQVERFVAGVSTDSSAR